MKRGDRVKLDEHGGEIIRRRVIEEKDGVIHVCLNEEFLAAEKEGREPEGIGFPLTAVKRKMSAS